MSPDSPLPIDPESADRGELEWRTWLERQGSLDSGGWVTALSREVERLLDDGRDGAAVRTLELAVSPVSPMFEGLTGPKARQLAARLEASWKRTDPGPRDLSLDARFRDLMLILDRWIRYRRNRRKETVQPKPVPAAAGTADAADAYLQNWVLMPLRENFLRILEDRGLSRAQFCELLELSESYLSQILSGQRNPSLRRLAEISRVLQVDLGRLFAVRAYAGRELPWAGAERPEPGDTASWFPGKVGRPYAALEAHYRLVFYPGPAIPEEKIVARSYLIVDANPAGMAMRGRYALQDQEDHVILASYLGTSTGGKRLRFMTLDGRRVEVAPHRTSWTDEEGVKGETRVIGHVAGTLVEF